MAALIADAEKLCWELRTFVSLKPAGDRLCAVWFKVGTQEFRIGAEPMPEDEAAHFAGMFVCALAGAFRSLSSSGAGDAAVETGWIAVEERLPEPGLICDWAFPATDPKRETWVLCGEAMLTASVPGRAAYWRPAQPMFPGSSPINMPEALSEEQIDREVEKLFPADGGLVQLHKEWLETVARPIARAIERVVIDQKGKA